MYNASATFKTLIKKTERTFSYSGTIVTTGGTTYTYDGGDMRLGRISRTISGDSLDVGTVYASEYDCELALSINRYELYGATITLEIQLEGASDVIPMGTFIISEVNQTADRLIIKAYDNMIKFDDVAFSPSQNTNIQSPYAWLNDMCTACGVTLGNTLAQIEALPNGSRNTGFADVVTDADSWRDVLGYLGAYLGSYAYIGRDGYLYLSTYGSISADTIPSSFRYSSELSDYKTTYDGIYATYKNDGIQEYVANSNTGGIVLDLGINPFLQFTSSASRQAAMSEIINAWNGIYYIPFNSDIPMNPTYDPGDVLTFTGNQAGAYDLGAITDITLNVGGQMNVNCSGENPRLSASQDRYTKSVAGLSAEYNNGQVVGSKNFWLLHTTNDAQIIVPGDGTKTLLAQLDWKQTVDVQQMGYMFTAEATLSDTAVVTILITVDDDASYEFEVTESKAVAGKRPLNSTCGFRVTGKQTHSAKVYLTVTDSATKWSDMV